VSDKDLSSDRISCFTCKTREITDWCVLPDDEVQMLENGRHMKVYGPGEMLFHEGDPCNGVYCIETGLVGIRKSDAEGNSVLLQLISPGDTVGYRAMLADEDFSASAEVLEPSRICRLDKGTVRSLLEKNPALGLRYLKKVSANLDEAEEKILHSATLSVRARFAHLLMVLLDRYGAATEDQQAVFELPLSRHDMASMIGTTPESMSRTIKKMESDNIALFDGRTVTIPSVDALVNEFEPDHFI